MCVHAYLHTTAHVWKPEDSFWEPPFSLSTLRAQGIKARSSDLVANTSALEPLRWFLQLLFETACHWAWGSLRRQADWPVSFRDPPVSASPALGPYCVLLKEDIFEFHVCTFLRESSLQLYYLA